MKKINIVLLAGIILLALLVIAPAVNAKVGEEILGKGDCIAKEIIGTQALGNYQGEGKTYKVVNASGTKQIAIIQVEDADGKVLAEPKKVKVGECFSFDNKQYLIVKSIKEYLDEKGKTQQIITLRFTCNCITEENGTEEEPLVVSTAEELLGKGPCEAHEITVGEQWGALGFFKGKGKTYKFVKGNEETAVIQVEDADGKVLAGPKEVKVGECFSFDNKQYLIIKKLEYYKYGGRTYLMARYKFTCDCAEEDYSLPEVSEKTEEDISLQSIIRVPTIIEDVSAEEKLAREDMKIERELNEQITENIESSTILQHTPNFLHRLWDKITLMQRRLDWQAQKISKLEIENALLSRRIARLEALLLPTISEEKETTVEEQAAGKLLVKVIDAERNPIKGARVIATPLGALTGATEKVFAAEKTDESGKAMLKLRPGKYLVRAEAIIEKEYQSSKRYAVKILPNQLTEVSIVLKATESKEMQETETVTSVSATGETGEVVIDDVTVKGPLQIKNKKLYVVKNANGKAIAQQMKNPKEALMNRLKEKLSPEQIDKLKNIRAEIIEKENKVKVTYERPNTVPIWNWIQPNFTERVDIPLEEVVNVPTEET